MMAAGYPNREAAHAALDELLNDLEVAGCFGTEATDAQHFHAALEAVQFAASLIGRKALRAACGIPPDPNDRDQVLNPFSDRWQSQLSSSTSWKVLITI
jgi:hypothetical protein